MRTRRPAPARDSGAQISRRTVARGAAWSAPLVAVAVASPAFAASPPADPTDPAGTCFKGSASYVRDLLYVGPINTLRNTIFFIDSVGGTCTGRDDIRLTVVQGATREEAAVRCVGLTGVGVRSSLAGMGYNTAPSDYYMCGVPAL